MSLNSFGRIFKFTTWGESHGTAIGVVVDGVPPSIPLAQEDIQTYLDQRKPGQSKFTTQRQEADKVQILSGVFEGYTTGTSLSLIIYNTDARSKDYGEIVESFRPGHADFTYHAKYGRRDYRGGGRSSARETASRVAAGAIARKVLETIGVRVRGALVQIGDSAINRDAWDWDQVNANPFWCPDAQTASKWEDYLGEIRKQGSSIGALIEVHAHGVPPGWGAPIYGKLDSDLAGAMMTINAVKGVEIGCGFAAVTLTGQENADPIRIDPKTQKPIFLKNQSGGILGGISTGQDIVCRFAVKPTSSILTPQPSINIHGQEVYVRTKGRHDPCVGIRAVPVGEAMMACTLLDAWMQHQAQTGLK